MLVGVIISWQSIPEDPSGISGTVVESAVDGQPFRLLATVPAPDTFLVVPDSSRVRVKYRAAFYNENGAGPIMGPVSGLTLDWAENHPGGTGAGYIVAYTDSGNVMLSILIREPTRWTLQWANSDTLEPVEVNCVWDLNNDGVIYISDFSFLCLSSMLVIISIGESGILNASANRGIGMMLILFE